MDCHFLALSSVEDQHAWSQNNGQNVWHLFNARALATSKTVTCHTLCTIMHTQCQKQVHCFYSGGNRFVTSGVQKSVWQPMHWSILLCTSRCVLFHCWAAAVLIKVCACTSHQLQDRFTCECFLLLVLFALLCQLWDDGIEGWSKERGDAHVNANWGGSRRIRRGRNL